MNRDDWETMGKLFRFLTFRKNEQDPHYRRALDKYREIYREYKERACV